MVQNKISWSNIVSVVCINDLPITLALIMPYHWYGIISRKWVVINTKYLSSNSFLIWNNVKIYCCSHFKCHIYKCLLNIITMLEGWERLWWAGYLGWWLKYSLLIGQLSLFTINKSTWSCLYGGFLCPSPVYLFDHCFFCILC